MKIFRIVHGVLSLVVPPSGRRGLISIGHAFRIAPMNENWHEYWKAMCEARVEAQRTAVRATMEVYVAKLDQFRAKAESFGYAKDHPFIAGLARQAAEARSLDIPVPPIPPAIEIPSFEFTAPETPRFEFPKPPEPPAK